MTIEQHCRKQFVLVIRLFYSTDLFLDIDTSIIKLFIKVGIFHCMDWLAAVAGCLGVGSLEDVAKVQFGFAGYCKVVLNSTVGASLTPCRTFKLFQTRVLAQNLQQISLSPLGGGGVFSLD